MSKEIENSTHSTDCLNCGAHISSKFCSECGQSADTHEINFHFLWHDIQHGILHFEKGLLFTLKELFIRPGKAIQEFIAGKRVQHMKPVAMLFLIGGIYSVLKHLLHLDVEDVVKVTEGSSLHLGKHAFNASHIMKSITGWMNGHYALTRLLLLPFISFATWLSFRNYSYNYVQHFVLNCFISSQGIAINLLSLPFLYFSDADSNIKALTTLFAFVFEFWTFATFFSKTHFLKDVLRVILAYIIFTFIVILLVVAGAGITFAILNQH